MIDESKHCCECKRAEIASNAMLELVVSAMNTVTSEATTGIETETLASANRLLRKHFDGAGLPSMPSFGTTR